MTVSSRFSSEVKAVTAAKNTNSRRTVVHERVTWRAKAVASRRSLHVSSIPKGLRNKAQGCEERATLGEVTDDSQPQWGCGMVLFPLSTAATLSGLSSMSRAFSQG